MSDTRNSGDAWVTASDGSRYWGKYGAAGLVVHHPQLGVLLQHRVHWSDHGNTWGIPGGALHEGESVIDGALRESHEEAGVPRAAVHPRFTFTLNLGGWSYTTVLAESVSLFTPRITDQESSALRWVPVPEVEHYPLHPAFAASWPVIRPYLGTQAECVVDAQSVLRLATREITASSQPAASLLCTALSRLQSVGVSATTTPQHRHPRLKLTHMFPEWITLPLGDTRSVINLLRTELRFSKFVTVFTDDCEAAPQLTELGADVRPTAQLAAAFFAPSPGPQ